MKILSISTGLATLLTMLPMAAQAAPYCGERVCHSYDSNGACNNYTCFGGGNGYDNRYNYGDQYDYRYSNYTNRSTSRCSYYGDYNRGGRTSYNTNCYNNLNYDSRYYGSQYNNTRYYDNRYYRDSSNYSSRRYDRAYYYDDYNTGYNDRVYVPKAGYYYRY